MPRGRTSRIWAVDRDTLQKIIDRSESIRQALKKLGYGGSDGTHSTFYKRCEEDGIDLTDLRERGKLARARNTAKANATPLDEILIENSTYHRGHLKRRLIKEGILKEQCAKCSLGTEWQCEPLVLIIDHINGVGDDHRLENLRLLCPNCNSQTPTFAGRNTGVNGVAGDARDQWHKRDRRKPAEIDPDYRNKPKPHLRKVTRPSAEDLQAMIDTMTWTAIGEQYGVSGNCVKKWAKIYGLTWDRRRRHKLDNRNCEHCGIVFHPDSIDRMFCSVSCANESKKSHIPSKEQFERDMTSMDLEGLKAKYGVSRQTLQIWAKDHSLTWTPRPNQV